VRAMSYNAWETVLTTLANDAEATPDEHRMAVMLLNFLHIDNPDVASIFDRVASEVLEAGRAEDAQ
jgi:hypothetical protein